MKKIICLGILLISFGCSGQELPRKIFHGFNPVPLSHPAASTETYHGDSGIYIVAIAGNGTAVNAEMQRGDILLAINSHTIRRGNDLQIPEISGLSAGDDVTYTVFRNGEVKELHGVVQGRPLEQGDSHRTEYFSIPFDGGRLRAIANLPGGEGPFPTVFLIQGYTCASVESDWDKHPHREMARALTQAGIAMIRVEKPGVGDSDGTPDCMHTDFHYEVESFGTAAEFARNLSYVDASRFYLFGHSMGGYLAPIIAQKVETSGIAAYGTRHEPWREYFLQMWRFQLVRQGFDYVEVENRMDDYYELAYQLFFKKKSPETIAEEFPQLTDEMRDGLLWKGGDVILYRNYQALQSVDELPVVEAWAAYNHPVLMMYGTADFEVFADDSPKEIVRIVNHYHPGMAEYREIPGSDHALFQVGSMDEGLNMTPQQQQSARMRGIDPAIPQAIVDWIERSSDRTR